MASATEIVLERRLLRRRLTFWRNLAFLALSVAIGFLVLGREETSLLFSGNHIARISIEGTITEWREQLELIKKIKDNKKVTGVLLFINSPGGTTSGGEALFEQIRSVAQKKPVVAQFGTIAASAGYIVGLAADHIVSRGNTITGSIGVIVQWPEVSDLLAKLGVKMNEVKSGELKASPSPFMPADDASKAVLKEMIDDGYLWFSHLVETRRGIKIADVPGLDKGRIFSGREALKLRLVDEIGGEEQAKLWLEEKAGLKKDLDIIDWKPEHRENWGFFSSLGGAILWLVNILGLEMRKIYSNSVLGQTSGLDGLVSVWQPPSTN
ncbi:MAG: signal peptide peptidase SppA [Hyphomicrobium sp.]